MIIQRGDLEEMSAPLLIALIEECWLTLKDLEEELSCYSSSSSAASQYHKLDYIKGYFKEQDEKGQKNVRDHGTPEMIADMEKKHKENEENPPSGMAFLEWKH